MTSPLWTWSKCFLLLAFGLCLAGERSSADGGPGGANLPDAVCGRIANAISPASGVFHPGEPGVVVRRGLLPKLKCWVFFFTRDPLYDKGIFHYASSSTQNATCVVEAGSPADVGKIVKHGLHLRRVIFKFDSLPEYLIHVASLGCTCIIIPQVKGGGHIINQGFSSTTGVQISMYRFSEIKYDPAEQTVDIGPGLIWDDVYAALEPLGVNVIGGRVTGVGVAGFTLGGGYSYKSNQYGIAVDNVVSYQLVKPDGTISIVDQNSDPELFFGLKGGYNNFGIVTRFTVKAFPQTQVWGGTIIYDPSSIPAFTAACVKFQSVTDPKAAAIVGFGAGPTTGLSAQAYVFYDAQTPPPGIFDDLLAIPSVFSDASTRSYLSLIQSAPLNDTQGTRMVYQGMPMITLTPAISDLLLNETIFWEQALSNKSEISVAYLAELFLPNLYSHSTSPAAYPPVRNIPFKPFVLNYAWNEAEFDEDFRQAARASSEHVRKVALEEGETQMGLLDSAVYPNYAIKGTPLGDMYGENVPALHALKMRVDPDNVMGLAGGWKF